MRRNDSIACEHPGVHIMDWVVMEFTRANIDNTINVCIILHTVIDCSLYKEKGEMQKVLLIDDKWYFRSLWMWGLRDKFTFLHANTIEQAKKIFRDHPDLAAIVVDAHMNRALGINSRIPIREWGFDTKDLIAELKLKFSGPVIAAPCQPWHFQLMMNAGCTHYAWKWSVARLLKEIL